MRRFCTLALIALFVTIYDVVFLPSLSAVAYDLLHRSPMRLTSSIVNFHVISRHLRSGLLLVAVNIPVTIEPQYCVRI